MSTDRDELERLVHEIPEDQVPLMLADTRRHLRLVEDRSWPPAFFASARGDGTRTPTTTAVLNCSPACA